MPEASGSRARAVAGVGVFFASNGLLYASLLPWYPLIVDRLELSSAEFGLVVACFAAGAISSSVLPSRLIGRFGAVPVSVVGTVAAALVLGAVAWSPSAAMLAACIFLIGALDATVDAAQNVTGTVVQDRTGLTILSSMHALWSLGGLLGGATATAAAAAGIDIRLHLALTGAGCVLLVLIGGMLLRGAGPRESRRAVLDVDEPGRSNTAGHACDEAGRAGDEAGRAGDEAGRIGDTLDRDDDGPPAGAGDAPAAQGRGRRALLLAVLPLALVAVCGVTVEDIANNWSALAAVQLGGIPVSGAGIAFSVAIGSQCVGRFSGDLLTRRFGASRIAVLGGLLIAAGGALLVTASGSLQLLLGLAALGYGSATLVPGALNAAAHLPGVDRAVGVTVVNWIMRLGFLGTSPLVGLLAEAAGLRWGLAPIIVVGVVTMVFARRLDR